MKPLQPLTTRESQVAELLDWGAIKKEIALRLRISIHTVNNIAERVYKKLDLRSVNQLAAWWFSKMNEPINYHTT